jgi:hypothetical protein
MAERYRRLDRLEEMWHTYKRHQNIHTAEENHENPNRAPYWAKIRTADLWNRSHTLLSGVFISLCVCVCVRVCVWKTEALSVLLWTSRNSYD